MPLELKITTEQQVMVHLNPTTSRGKPVAVDGIPTWEVAAGDVILQPSATGLDCNIVSPDSAGESQVLVSADADLGEGVTTITDTIKITAGDPQATSLGLKADAPVDKP